MKPHLAAHCRDDARQPVCCWCQKPIVKTASITGRGTNPTEWVHVQGK